jgi:hypothetical protein
VKVYALWVYNVTNEISYESIFMSSPASALLLDRVLTGVQILVLSQIEVNVAIIYASAPALRPILRNVSPDLNQLEAYVSDYEHTIGSASAVNERNPHNRTRSSGQISLLLIERRRLVTSRTLVWRRRKERERRADLD